ncbi:MAG: N-acetyltransferase family protein [Halobacteriaceae archaeon]
MSVNLHSGVAGGVPWDHTNCDGTAVCPPRCPRFVDDHGAIYHVEQYTDEHFEPLVAFYEAYPERHRSMSLPPLTRRQIESWLERLVSRGKNLLVFDGTTVVGHVAYSPRDAAESELVVFVGADYQNRGLGTELCRHAIAHAAADGQSSMRLAVATDNESAIRVYTSLGFREVDRRAASIVMALDLDASRSDLEQAPAADPP